MRNIASRSNGNGRCSTMFTAMATVVFVALAACWTQLPGCAAHVALTYPPARHYDLDFLDNSRTPGPCGMPKGEWGIDGCWWLRAMVWFGFCCMILTIVCSKIDQQRCYIWFHQSNIARTVAKPIDADIIHKIIYKIKITEDFVLHWVICFF